jgi:hypothetical protein
MKIEFSTMPSVNGNAVGNSLASSSKISTEGLFNPAGLSPLPPCSGSFKWETSGDMATIRFVMIHPVVFNWNDVTCGSGGGPLSQREWVAQQRHLARIAVHFTPRQLLREYASMEAFTDYPDPTRPYANPRAANSETVFQSWQTFTSTGTTGVLGDYPQDSFD